MLFVYFLGCDRSRGLRRVDDGQMSRGSLPSPQTLWQPIPELHARSPALQLVSLSRNKDNLMSVSEKWLLALVVVDFEEQHTITGQCHVRRTHQKSMFMPAVVLDKRKDKQRSGPLIRLPEKSSQKQRVD